MSIINQSGLGTPTTGANERFCEPYKVFAKTKEDLMPYLLNVNKEKTIMY